jgi:hypothetical protein
MMKVTMQMLIRMLKKEQLALKPKHKLKVVADVVVVVTVAARVVQTAVVKVVETVALVEQVADNAVVLHKVADKPVAADLVVEGDNVRICRYANVQMTNKSLQTISSLKYG